MACPYPPCGIMTGRACFPGWSALGASAGSAPRSCLKRSGLEIRDIRQFMEWCTEGSGTYAQRLELFVRQEERVLAELDKLQKALDVIRFKRWYYEQALQDGNEEGIRRMLPDGLPEEIQAIYDRSFLPEQPKG